MEIPFEVREERLYFQRFEIDTGQRALELVGSFGLEGAKDIRASIRGRRD